MAITNKVVLDIGEEQRSTLILIDYIVSILQKTYPAKSADVLRLELTLGVVTYNLPLTDIALIKQKVDQLDFGRDVKVT